jgi:hypothetical protein
VGVALGRGDAGVAEDLFSNSQEYANRLGHSTELGNDPTVRKAVADVRTATYAAYIELDKFETGYLPRVTENLRGDVARFRAIGFSAQHDTDIGSFNVRLVLN